MKNFLQKGRLLFLLMFFGVHTLLFCFFLYKVIPTDEIWFTEEM